MRKSVCFIILALLTGCCDKLPTQDESSIMPDEEGRYYPMIDLYPTWSPDGSTIAYFHNHYTEIHEDGSASFDPDSFGIYLINPDGTNRRRYPHGDSRLVWSPDNRWVLFSIAAALYKAKINGDSLTLLTSEGSMFHPDWSSDGSRIVFSNAPDYYTYAMWFMRPDGSGLTYFGEGLDPVWHPSGELIIYRWMGIWLETVDHRSKIRIYPEKTWWHKIDPTGNTIGFVNKDWEMWAMDIDGSNLRMLHGGGCKEFGWSPDGSRIVYNYIKREVVLHCAINGTLWIMDADGTNRWPLTFGPQRR